MAMQEITDVEVKGRLALDNPWWGERGAVDQRYRDWPRRAYFKPFLALVTNLEVQRAVVLMGPRRVGKTVMIHQTIQRLIDEGVTSGSILYLSLDTPIYFGLGLERILTLFREAQDHAPNERLYVFFDEIQYLKGWEVHLKSLVDTFPSVRFVASGSAAAALRMKSDESGAGRFTDFLLPPLTFHEFVLFVTDEIWPDFAELGDETFAPDMIRELNRMFVDFLNYGGFPEAVLSEAVRNDFERFVGSDIIDKVLLRDLPSLYGISDPQELNRLFVSLAYNSGGEVSLEALSQSSGVAKNTLKRYLDYMEAGFLIQRVHRVDRNARRFKRTTTFKVYLTNPCLRAALFGPVKADDPAMGLLAETAVFSQIICLGARSSLYYARWETGEVDLVVMDFADQPPGGAIEIKWSDRAVDKPSELSGLAEFVKRNRILSENVFVLTRSRVARHKDTGLHFGPVASFCYHTGAELGEYLRLGIVPQLTLLGKRLAPNPASSTAAGAGR